MTVIEFRTLGTLDLRRADGKALHSLLAQPKRVALLAYLCVAKPHGYHRRDTLLGLFWPDADQTHARASLRNALHVLRHSLGEAVVQSRGDEEISLDFDAIWCDAALFEDRVASDDVDGALDLYRGDFLTGFFLEDVPAFERWLDGERIRLRAGAARAAGLAAERHETERNLTDAVSLARRALDLTGTDERALRRLVELLARTGDRAGALQAYDRFAKHLAVELEAEPSAETRALVARLRGSEHEVPTAHSAPTRALTMGARGDRGLKEASSTTSGSLRTGRRSRRFTRVTGAAAAIIAATALILTGRRITQRPLAPPAPRQITYSGRAFKPAISPDGHFLAYVAEEGDSLNVIVQDLASGGRPNNVATITDATTIEWSGDGAQLLIGSFDPIRSRGLAFTVPRAGGERRPIAIANGIGANVFAYWVPERSPGDSRVSLHSDPDKRILVADLRTQDTVAIPVQGDYDALFDGSWAPQGGLFAVSTMSVKPVQSAIRIARQGGNTHVVAQDTVALGSPRWSPAGDAVYYARGSSSVWRVPVSPKTGEPLGAPSEMEGSLEILLNNYLSLPHFAVTSDGTRMTYAKGRRYSNLWWLETGVAARATPLTNGTALRWSPVVSPDGKWIAFAQETEGTADVFLMPIGGGAASQLTFGARVRPQTNIGWSPAGDRIAFGSVRGGRSQVWVANLESGQLGVLPQTNLSAVTGHLAWAPSSRIVYQGAGNKSIHVVDPITAKDRALDSTPNGSLFQRPRFSPDGNRIAVAWNRGAGDFGVWIIDLTGSSRERKIADGWLWPIGWSGDSRYVYASLYSGPTVYRVDTRGGRRPESILKPSNGWRGLGRNSPVRELECSPAGPRSAAAFLCAAFDFVSDIWMVENFGPAKN